MNFKISFKGKPFFIVFLLFFLLSFRSEGQIWTKIYWYASGQKSDKGKSVIETTDGALLVAGGYLGHLIKLDKDGNILWRKSYPGIDQATDLTLTADGGICVVGIHSTTPAKQKTWLIKTNATGDVEWSRLLEEIDTGFPALIENNEGGFTILGVYDSGLNILITDSQGNILKKNWFDVGGATRFIQLENGHYVVIPTPNFLLIDSDGNKIWEIELPGVRSVAAANDNQFVVMGYNDSENAIFLSKWDVEGNELWYKTYPQLDARPFQYLWNEVVINTRGEIAFIAYVDGTSAFIAKTDREGNLVCAKIQQFNPVSVILESLVPTADKGYAVVGTRNGNNSDEDLFLMKTDSLCQIDDLEIIYNIDGDIDTIYTEKFSFKYGPNPCSEKVNFEIQPTEPFDGKMFLTFFDPLGREVKRETVLEGTLSVYLYDLPSGMYVFWIRKDGKTLGKGKLAVQR